MRTPTRTARASPSAPALQLTWPLPPLRGGAAGSIHDSASSQARMHGKDLGCRVVVPAQGAAGSIHDSASAKRRKLGKDSFFSAALPAPGPVQGPITSQAPPTRPWASGAQGLGVCPACAGASARCIHDSGPSPARTWVQVHRCTWALGLLRAASMPALVRAQAAQACSASTLRSQPSPDVPSQTQLHVDPSAR